MEQMQDEITQQLPSATASLKACIARNATLLNDIKASPDKFRVLTGERTTGALHIGHYFGSLKNRVDLQKNGVDMYLILADYQAITDRNSTDAMRESVENIILDYLATGIDPKKATIFCHSYIASLNQLL